MILLRGLIASASKLSTIHGVKGYDAMIVFLVGVDQFEESAEDRAAFYVGATRSKLALYLTGIQKEYGLLHEAREVLGIIGAKSASAGAR
jgi:superfamily I DNA/RNA helicase